MNRKEEAYRRLVEKRKSFGFADLLNPSEIEGGKYDRDHVELWAQWMGNLHAKIMLVGKDFGGKTFFLRFRGGCDPNSTTNRNLVRLFASLGIDIGSPDRPNHSAPVFFTNAVFGIIDTSTKGGNSITSRILKESAMEFLRPLIDVVAPKIIVAMGKEAYRGVCIALGLEGHKTLGRAFESSPVKTATGKFVFPMYHCGGLGLTNRPFDHQQSDWSRMREYL